MPDLTKLPVPEYQPDQPYHVDYDNLPLSVLEERDEIINDEVNRQSQILNDAAGTQGDIANRINQSIEENGDLKTSAVDQTLHNIAEHTDSSITVDDDELAYYTSTLGYNSVSNPVPFVRMLESERDRLALVADEATNLAIQVATISNITLYNEGTIELAASDSIYWEVNSNIIKPVLAISTAFAHRHYYDLEPVTTDFQNFSVTNSNTPCVEGSIRVYLNGIRLSTEYDVYYPSNPVSTWSLNKFTPNEAAGTFVLENIISETDIIRIDFDLALS